MCGESGASKMDGDRETAAVKDLIHNSTEERPNRFCHLLRCVDTKYTYTKVAIVPSRYSSKITLGNLAARFEI